MRLILLLTGIFFIPIVGFSATIYVPDDYPTIQDAIDGSVNGDTIIVRAGIYVENIDFLGKVVHVTSESGPASTIIDGNQAGTAVWFQNGEGADSAIDGFTVTNSSGSAIRCSGSSPTITNNIILENHNTGIYCNLSSFPTISNNIISNNYGSDGGGIRCRYDSSPTIINNIIRENNADYGGGIFSDTDCSPTIANNVISLNYASGDYPYYPAGGGIFSYFATITNNIIAGNTASSYGNGGGISCELATITNNIIMGNDAGGGAPGRGGGIDCGDYSIIANNTITGNSAKEGGGINCPSTAVITNTILWDNNAQADPEIFVYGGGNPIVTYCDVKGGWPGTGNIDAAPLFVDAPNGDYHLTCISPCYGAGDNNAPGLPSTDFEGDPRIIHGNVEIGADEFFCHLYYVGSPVPGGTIGVRVAAIPGQEVTLYRGNDVLPHPYWTGHGYLYITWPPAASWFLGKIPSTGVLQLDVTVPPSWVPGNSYFFQAQVGQWGNTYSWLTNLNVVTAE